MNSQRLALSSIAVSGCAMALLGLSNIVRADDPDTCAPGWPCLLGYTTDWYHPPYGGTPWPGEDGHWNYGYCGFDQTASPQLCSCAGWAITYVYVASGSPTMPPESWTWTLMFYPEWVSSPLDPQCYFPVE